MQTLPAAFAHSTRSCFAAVGKHSRFSYRSLLFFRMNLIASGVRHLEHHRESVLWCASRQLAASDPSSSDDCQPQLLTNIIAHPIALYIPIPFPCSTFYWSSTFESYHILSSSFCAGRSYRIVLSLFHLGLCFFGKRENSLTFNV